MGNTDTGEIVAVPETKGDLTAEVSADGLSLTVTGKTPLPPGLADVVLAQASELFRRSAESLEVAASQIEAVDAGFAQVMRDKAAEHRKLAGY